MTGPEEESTNRLIQSEHIARRRTHDLNGDQTWAQVGWIGQSGRVYGAHADPYAERGGFSPLWLLIEDEPPLIPDGEVTE